MVIIGITGTIGAGKGTVVEFLVKEKNFKHFSARDFITGEIIKRGLEVNRDNMVVVANDLRGKNSPSFVADELFKKAVETGENCVIESLRTVGEVESLRSKGDFILLAVDADPQVRYERISGRGTNTDNVSFEKFIEQEKREMDSNNSNKQNLKKCIEMADFVVDNNGIIDELNSKIEQIYEEISK
jgi:dephospho-CoA kinase